MVKLSELKAGQTAQIYNFIDPMAKCYSQRFGIEEGQIIKCIAKPGAVVIQRNNQVIAIGKNLSKQIYIKLSEI